MEPEGKYTVKSAYSWQKDYGLAESVPEFEWLWKIHAPSNVKVFIWKVFWNRIQTKDNLLKRGIIHSSSDSKCPFCNVLEESTSHLLFGCSFSYKVWQLCYRWLGFSVTLPYCSRSHFLQHPMEIANRGKKLGLWAVWGSVVWTLDSLAA